MATFAEAGAAFRAGADALANHRAAALAHNGVERHERATAKALKLAHPHCDAGHAALLEPLDAQRTADAARLDRVRNPQAQLNARVDRVKALGGGWQAGPR